jgi:hypothetical protein
VHRLQEPEGEYVLINGNQIGVMLEYNILARRQEARPCSLAVSS